MSILNRNQNQKLSADQFLLDLHSGEATVNADELRTLLKNYRASIREIKRLEERNDILLLQNGNLKLDLAKAKIRNDIVKVTGIDTVC